MIVHVNTMTRKDNNMRRPIFVRTLPAIAGGAALLLMAPPASATHAPLEFACKASLVRVERVNHWVAKIAGFAGQPVPPLDVEPVAANGGAATCASATAGSPSPTTLPSGLGSVSARQVTTTAGAASASATAQAADVLLTLPGLPPIRVELLGSQSTVSCNNGVPTLGGASRVGRIETGAPVNQVLELPDSVPGFAVPVENGDTHHRHITVGSQGIGSDTVIHLNHFFNYDRDGDGVNDSQQRQALYVSPNTTIQPSDTVVGETSVGVSGCHV